MSLEFDNIALDYEGDLAWITLNRPERLNAFGEAMRDELLQALLDIQEQDHTRVVIITGAGRGFCAGGDIETMVSMKNEQAEFDRLRPNLEAGRRVIDFLHQFPRPVIAMVNGAAAGAGCSLALACDIRIASDSASFSQSFINVGLHPDWGSTFFLPRLVGTARALELMWTGRRVEVEEAEEMGLVHQVVPQAHLREHTTRFAQRMAKAPATAVRLIKLAVYNSFNFDLDGMLEYETDAQEQCWASPESTEGILAFSERRRPVFDRT